MSLFTLYTYSSIDELRQIQKQYDVIPFSFDEVKELLEENPTIIIDITAIVYFVQTNKGNRYFVSNNLKEMTNDTKIIIEEEIAGDALSFFPYLFSDSQPFYESQEQAENEQDSPVSMRIREPIYTYHNTDDLKMVIEYANANNIPIATFSGASGALKDEFEKFNQSAKLALLDLTSAAYAIENNKNLIYLVEIFLNQFKNVKLIALTSQIDQIVEYFPLYVEGQEPIDNLIPSLSELSPTDDTVTEIKRIVELSKAEFKVFIENFDHSLIGHKYFKERFKYALSNFIALNNVREQKVLSIFLFGASGIGKTEVARLIANGLQQDSYLAKINFQNYSSQDSLNSLIGSPAGYIGCEHGELSDKVKKSKVGVVLCDEFEKTTRPVFSFFLEVLEEGKFTDSMAREYDLDGYILVFTSNLINEAEYKKVIPLELQTRFDIVCEFQEPSYAEKTLFLDLLMEKAEGKFAEHLGQIQMTPQEKKKLYDFNYSNLSALRDIKKIFNNRLMDFFTSKGLL